MTPDQSSPISQCISLDYDDMDQDRREFYGVTFNLTQQSLPQLLEIQSAQRRLKLPAQFWKQWQYHALFGNDGDLQRTWSFVLLYEEQGIFKTLVTRDGEIITQVCADVLPHTILYRQLFSIHGWLIQQLLAKLRLPVPQGKWITPVAWIGAIALACIVIGLTIPYLMSQPIWILPIMLLAWILQWGFKKLLRSNVPYLQQHLLRQVLWGRFSGDRHRRRKGLNYWNNL